MQLKLHMVTIDDLMPQEHFLRKLEVALDLSFVYEEISRLYSRKYGRPLIEPVVLVGFLYGIPSERQIEQRIQTDVALRWYLGLDLFDRVPDHSTISHNCGGGSRPFERYSDGCLRKWCGNVSPPVWSAGGWQSRILPM